MTVFSPKELFIKFSYDHCDGLSIGTRGMAWGFGARYDIDGLTQLMKLLPYSCMNDVTQLIKNSVDEDYKKAYGNSPPAKGFEDGAGKLALPYKFLQILDPDAFQEIQISMSSSHAYAIRNAADISRACDTFIVSRAGGDSFYKWEGRGATEVMDLFGASFSFEQALFLMGPNFVVTTGGQARGNGCGGEYPDYLSCMPEKLTAKHYCECPPFAECPPTKKICKYPTCPPTVCKTCAEKSGHAQETSVASGTFGALDGKNYNGEDQFIKYHVGYLTRKSYPGYANFITQGDPFVSSDNTIFLKQMQSQNGVNYKKAQYDDKLTKHYVHKKDRKIKNEADIKIKRIKTITMVSTPTHIKNCLHNGYGVVITSNVGFSDKRNSIGISYPDRLWYHTMAIIGYDDTKRLYHEGLYLFANSWGDWNYGGHPDWGPLPKGSFLVTESHLACMLRMPRVDKMWDCRVGLKKCRMLDQIEVGFIGFRPPATLVGAIHHESDRFTGSQRIIWVYYDFNGLRHQFRDQVRCDKFALLDAEESGNNCFPMQDCDYISCGPNQKPWGYAFALSFDDDPPFRKKDMRYEQFFMVPPS